MANWNNKLGRKWELYPGVDFGWRMFQPLKFYLSVNKSLRMPTFTDLYYKSATNLGNPDLLPEEALSFETGLKFSHKWLTAHISLFERRGKNMIDWVRLPIETVWVSKNITKLATRGAEIAARISPEKLFGKQIFIQSVDLSYGFLNQDKESGNYLSKYLLDYLKHKADLRFTHTILKNLSANWLISYQERNGTYTSWDGTKYGNEVPYTPLWLLDSRINWVKKQLCLFVEASNLLNKHYFDYGNVEQPGMWAKAGVTLKLGL